MCSTEQQLINREFLTLYFYIKSRLKIEFYLFH